MMFQKNVLHPFQSILKMETVVSAETSANFYQITKHHSPEDTTSGETARRERAPHFEQG
jgi:hypothetical protein